jgi:CheY-like chemotaxis protein
LQVVNKFLPAEGERYIIYADDNVDDQLLLMDMMTKINPLIRVLATGNGLELIQYLESLSIASPLPSCILLDKLMPVWDGIRTLRTLKTSHLYKQIPAYIFSNSNEQRDITLVKSMGIVDYIIKPYNHKDLQKVCKEIAECSNQPIQYKQNILQEVH